MKDLYIIQSKVTGLLKIGRTSNINQRLKTLRTGNGYELRLILLLPQMGHMEHDIHDKLRHYREKGEWFRSEGLSELPVWLYELIDLNLLYQY